MDILIEAPTSNPAPETVGNPLPMVAAAVVAGIGMELVVHNWLVDGDAPGVGASGAVILAVIGIVQGTRLTGHNATKTALGLYAAAIGFATLISFRASPVLAALNIISAVCLVGAGIASHRPQASKPTTLTDFARTGKSLAFHGAFGAALVAGRDVPQLESSTSWETARRVVIGIAIALPLLLIFGGLFASADQVFGDSIRRITSFEISDAITAGLLLAAVLAWITLGWLRLAVTGSRRPEPAPVTRRLGLTESLTILWLINALFALFVAFQAFEVVASYRSASVEYAQQARNGFFQLVGVATLVVAVILVMDWLSDTTEAGGKRLRSHQLALILLTTVVLGSAVVRMAFYIEAYGLTELRFYTSAFMVWVGFLLTWLVRTVLAGRRSRFARPALAGLLTVILALNLINPDGVIASYNMSNQSQSGSTVDTTYLVAGLSVDAVPSVLQNLDSVGDECSQADLVRRLRIEPIPDIRSWNLARSRAAALLASTLHGLEQSCEAS